MRQLFIQRESLFLPSTDKVTTFAEFRWNRFGIPKVNCVVAPVSLGDVCYRQPMLARSI